MPNFARSLFLPNVVIGHELAHAYVAFLEGCLVTEIICERGWGHTAFLPPLDGWTRGAEARVWLAGVTFEPGIVSHDDVKIAKTLWAAVGSPPGWIEARKFEVREMLARPEAKRIIDALWRAVEDNDMRLDGGDVMRLASEASRA